MTALPTLILASASPRRRELLGGLGLRFTIRAVDLDETPRPGEPPDETVRRLAREKAAAQGHPGELALAAGRGGGVRARPPRGGWWGRRRGGWWARGGGGQSGGPPRTPATCSAGSPAASTPC